MSYSVYDQTHPSYNQTIDAVLAARDAVEGTPAIKNGPRASVYLPNPWADCNDSSDDKYPSYKSRAEYDNFPARTESGYLGALNSTPANFEDIPADVQYLINDSDGDGLSLQESIEITQSNILEVKFHGLLADFNGVTDIDDKVLTKAQAIQAGIKANIKQYPRESITDWSFANINGKNQLSYVKLSECVSQINTETFAREEVINQLVLALDEEGFYFQQQILKNSKGDDVFEERIYPENNGGRMDFIPFEFCVDQKKESKTIPKALGILYPVCLKAISRYQVSADLKLALFNTASPTMWSSGWTQSNYESYKDMTGNDKVKVGSNAHLPLPEGASAGYLQWDADSNALFEYMVRNEKEAKALGARFNTEDPKDEAVGVAKIRTEEELSSLVNIQSSIEESYKRVIEWCYLFMSNNQEMPDFSITLNKEFNKVKLTPQERKSILDDFMGGLIDREEAYKQLKNGGILEEEVDVLLNRVGSLSAEN